MKKWHSECYFLLSGLKGRWTPLLNPICSAGDLVYIITSLYLDSLHSSACRLFFLPMFLLTFRPQKPPVISTPASCDWNQAWMVTVRLDWSTSWQPAFSHCLSAAQATLCLLWAAVMRDLHPWLVLSHSAHLRCRPDSLGESSQY